MPRKQRTAKPRRAEDTLRRELLDLLLNDFPSLDAIDAMNTAAPDSYDPFHEFLYSVEDAARLRVQHREQLLEEVRRRGLPVHHLDQVRLDCDDARRLKGTTP